MQKSLRIAMLAPIKRSLTPLTTVSRSRVMVDLASGLIQKGHHVTIFATKDSYLAGAKIIAVVETGLNFLPAVENPFYQHTAYLTRMIAQAVTMQDEFDLIHNHMYPEYLALLALSAFKTPLLTTVHSQMTQETIGAFKLFPQANLVAISHMAKAASGIASIKVVHNSVDTQVFVPDDKTPKDYLLAVGRMSKARYDQGNFIDPKGIIASIAIAEKTGERLKLVGNVEDPDFFETLVKPHLSDKIEFVGEISSEQQLTREQMVKLFQGAKALLNPINWEEPFGLVMVEALSCGTPVIAYNRGAVAEIVVDGKVGFVVRPEESRQSSDISRQTGEPGSVQKTGIEGMVEAVKRIGEIDRKACRDHAVFHFSKERMVEDYERIYFELLRE